MIKINIIEEIGKMIPGDLIKFKKICGYPDAPGIWVWQSGVYIGQWSIDEVCVKFDNVPLIVNFRNIEIKVPLSDG